MISGRNRILFTRLNVINSLKCNFLNQTRLIDCNVLPNKSSTNNQLTSNLDDIILRGGNEPEKISIEYNTHAQESLKKTTVTPPVKNTSPLFEKFFLRLTEGKKDELTPSEVITMFVRINCFLEVKKNKFIFRKNKEEFFCDHFKELCQIINSSLNELDSDDLLLLIFFCKNIKVPDDYISFEKLYQEVDHRKNKLSLHELILLYHILLDNFKTNSCVLKKEYESLLLMLSRRKMKSKDLNDKLDVLARATMFPLPNKFKIDILFTILDLGEETWCKFNLTRNVLELLHTINSNDPNFRILEKKLIQVLMNYSKNRHFVSDIPLFLNILMQMVSFKKIEYRCELFDALGNAVLRDNISFDDKMMILLPLLRLKHIHRELLISILEEIKEKPELFNENAFFSIGKGLTYTNFKFENDQLEIFFNFISNLEVINVEANLGKYLLFLTFSICLGHYPDKVIKAVSEAVNKEEILIKKFEHWELLLHINNAVAVFHPSYSDRFLSQKKFLLAVDKFNGALNPNKSSKNFIIKKWIESAVGIENCVLTDSCTKYGLLIDQVMVLNKNGEPIRLPKEIMYVEDIFVPPDHKLVFILNYYHYMYCKNVHGMRAKHGLKKKLLQTLGGVFIPSSFTCEKNDLRPDSELSQYLWKQIKDRYVTKTQELPILETDEPITIPHYPYISRPCINDIDVIIPTEKQWMEGFLSTLEGQIWYTDGSLCSQGAGSGVYYPEGDFELSLNSEAESAFVAEVIAMLQCAKEAYASVDKKKNSKPVINIVTDSQIVIKFLVEEHVFFSKTTEECINAVDKLSEIASVRLIWAPGHSGIEGNVIADSLAKRAASGSDSE